MTDGIIHVPQVDFLKPGTVCQSAANGVIDELVGCVVQNDGPFTCHRKAGIQAELAASWMPLSAGMTLVSPRRPAQRRPLSSLEHISEMAASINSYVLSRSILPVATLQRLARRHQVDDTRRPFESMRRHQRLHARAPVTPIQ